MSASEKRQTLVVEDERIIAADLQDRLERLGYSVRSVTGSGRQALHLSRRQPFDLVLMNIRLKGGMDAIQATRAFQRMRDVPVVYVRDGKTMKPLQDRCSASEITIQKHQMERSPVPELEEGWENCETLAAHLNGAKESEYRRLARELHDDVQQRLSAIALEMEIQQDKREHSPQLRVAMSSASFELRQVCRNLHQLSHNLHPRVSEEMGLAAALRRLCREFGVLGLNVHFQRGKLPPVTQAKAAVLLYRVAQEILQHVLKHAGNNGTRVSLKGTPTGIILRVSNQSAGFDPQIVKNGSQPCLRSISDRVEGMGGTLQVTSKRGRGTEISALIPSLEDRP